MIMKAQQKPFSQYLLFIIVLVSLWGCSDRFEKKKIRPGMVISKDILFDAHQHYKVTGTEHQERYAIVVEGENVTVDFNGLALEGKGPLDQPDQFKGLGVWVRGGHHITIKNLSIRGFKTALFAENVDSLVLEQCNFSYNFRPRIEVINKEKPFFDTLSILPLDQSGGISTGVYLKNCRYPIIREVQITNGHHGILLHDCDSGLIYSNQVQFNSGIGLGAFHSDNNRILHNALDWNVNGHRQSLPEWGGVGIYLSEYSNNNKVAFNQVTHCRNGLLLRGKLKGEKARENKRQPNLIYKNDFSFATNCGVKAPQLEDAIIHNTFEQCHRGIIVDECEDALIAGNRLMGEEFGIAIGSGQGTVILQNLFDQYQIGIQLGELAGANFLPQKTMVQDFLINQNIFKQCKTSLVASKTLNLSISKNVFTPIEAPRLDPITNKGLVYQDNKIMLTEEITPLFLDTMISRLPPTIRRVVPLEKNTDSTPLNQNTSSYDLVLIGEWGPYNFAYPTVWLREHNDNQYTLLLLGPTANWQVIDAEGVAKINPQRGTFPATVVIETLPEANNLIITFSSIGEEMVDQFGHEVPKGQSFSFHFHEKIERF